ncbi:hypothetical protein PGQ11_001488 [Apiospora arundinis]|uniref:Uncharacterized protein n=1 Tax=Apiospora arundinis TaxID=335852 RepID=A0ABR2JND2_9PEZI
MSVDWGMAAVVVALSVFVAPIAWNGVTAQARNIYHRGRKVKQLKWIDISDGPVHCCRYTSGLLSQPYSQTAQGPLSSVLATIFNRAWDKSNARPRFIPEVPHELPTSASFLCTEPRVILAFALLAETSVDTLVKCKRIEDIIICQMRGGIIQSFHFRSTLSKLELQSLLEGYPPWYRESFTTIDNIKLPFPIRDARDITRGGWIVAVGLMNLSLDTQKPLRVYRSTGDPSKPGWGDAFRMAIVRCRDHIIRQIYPHFTNDCAVEDAITALGYLIATRTGSAMPWGTLDGRRATPPLRGSDCRFVMQHFNDYSALTDPADVTKYSRIIMPTMVAVVRGAFEVVQYLKDVGTELEIPPELIHFQEEIYIKIDD